MYFRYLCTLLSFGQNLEVCWVRARLMAFVSRLQSFTNSPAVRSRFGNEAVVRNSLSHYVRLALLVFGSLPFFFSASTAVAVTDYYVSASGSDSNDGSQAHPWATIMHAASALSLGTSSGSTENNCGDSWWVGEINVAVCVHVAAGTYTGNVTVNVSGTSTQRIVYISDVKWGALIRGTSGGTPWLVGPAGTSTSPQGNYVTVAGFDISTNASSQTYGVVTYGNYTHFVGLRVHDIPGSAATGTCTSNGGAGIAAFNDSTSTNAIAAQGVQVIGNWIQNIGVPGQCNKIHGMYIGHANSVIENNVVNNSAAWAINCTHQCTNSSVVSNNIAFNNGGYGTSNNGTFAMGGCVLLAGSTGGGTAGNTSVINNICMNNGAAGSGGEIYNISGGSAVINIVVLNNLIFNNAEGNGDTTVGPNTTPVSLGSGSGNIISGTINSDPKFVNYQTNGSGDYQLQASSPAVAAASSTCATGGISPCVPVYDFNYTPRVTPTSLGSYQVAAASTAPAPPTGLSAVVQ